MTKIYEDANNQHVGAYVVYGKLTAVGSHSGKLYVDEDFTEQLMFSDALEMFKRARVLVSFNNGNPVLCEVVSNVGPSFITCDPLPGSATVTSWDAKWK